MVDAIIMSPFFLLYATTALFLSGVCFGAGLVLWRHDHKQATTEETLRSILMKEVHYNV